MPSAKTIFILNVSIYGFNWLGSILSLFSDTKNANREIIYANDAGATI